MEMKCEGHGVFPLKSYYEELLTREESEFLHIVVWIPRVRRKVFFHLTSYEGSDPDGGEFEKKKDNLCQLVFHLQRMKM